MPSHYSRLDEELHSMKEDLRQRDSEMHSLLTSIRELEANIQALVAQSTPGSSQQHQATAESIQRVMGELQAKSQTIMSKSAELSDLHDEMKDLEVRHTALGALQPAIDVAMNDESAAGDLVQHVVENAIRSNHISGNQIVELILQTDIRVGGPIVSRGNYLQHYLMNVLDDRDSMRGVIRAATESLELNEVIQYTLESLVELYESTQEVSDGVKKVMDIIHGQAGTNAQSSMVLTGG